MIQQLVLRYAQANGLTPTEATLRILTAEPLNLILSLEQLWGVHLASRPAISPSAGVGDDARRNLTGIGALNGIWTDPALPAVTRPWDHLGYAYVLENTRVVQIMRRVIREYRSGEALGVPSEWTQRWLDTAEALAFGAFHPLSAWLSTSIIRPDAEAVPRNAYWRLFGMDLAFGIDDGRPFAYDKAAAANTTFVALFEELLYELWKAISNIRNRAGVNEADDDRIYRLAEQIGYNLRTRRQNLNLMREELVATTILGWFELSLTLPTPLTDDLKAQGSSPAERLKAVGERVGMASHSRSAAFFSMAADLSILLRSIEDQVVTGPEFAAVLYSTQPQPNYVPIGDKSRRVITEWSAATGKDLKTRVRPVQVQVQADGRRLVATGPR
jgi:hypothetical protein